MYHNLLLNLRTRRMFLSGAWPVRGIEGSEPAALPNESARSRTTHLVSSLGAARAYASTMRCTCVCTRHIASHHITSHHITSHHITHHTSHITHHASHIITSSHHRIIASSHHHIITSAHIITHHHASSHTYNAIACISYYIDIHIV